MKLKLHFLLPLLITFGVSAQSPQKKYNVDQQTWVGYFNQTRLSNKWGLWLDVHFRQKENFVEEAHQAIVRPGIIYYLSDRARLSSGYAFVNHFPAKGHEDISQPEHRVWQQFQWMQKYSGFNTMQWLRLEERYRRKIEDNEFAKGYDFNYRIRYNCALMIPLSGKTIEPKTFFLFLNNELHLNFGKKIVYNYFDQNRAFLGIAYQINTHSNVQLGYMNIFQQTASGNTYNTTHTTRLFLFHNLDLRKLDE